jgi:hypothetical protein
MGSVGGIRREREGVRGRLRGNVGGRGEKWRKRGSV